MDSPKIRNNIRNNVAETLYIPLMMKCNESRRRGGFYEDPFACEMVDKIDYGFEKYAKAVQSSVGVALRASYFDGVTRTFVGKTADPVVVNIGCGLDTRFLRLGKEVTGQTVTYELDLTEVMELRKKLLPESSGNPYISASMFETEWMDGLKEKHPSASFLFVVEGVLMYFEKERVRQVFQELAARFKHSEILFDVVSSWMCKNSHRHDTVKFLDAKFIFGCDDDREMESWDEKLALLSSRKYVDFEAWKTIGWLRYTLMKALPVFKDASRLLHYQIK